MRPPVDTIQAPPFPAGLPWVNVAPLRMDRQIGRPVLIEFWDFCRVNSLRTLPYIGEWHRRYADDGLRVIGVHSPGFEPSSREDSVREAVARLGVEHIDLCTSCNPELFFSHRRDNGVTGRQGGMAWLTA